MMMVGSLLSIFAFYRFNAINRWIETGVVRADRSLVIIVTAIVIILVAALIIYMWVSEGFVLV